MSRPVILLRAAAVAVGTAVLLVGCVSPVVAPVPVDTPKPEPDFGSIGGESPVPLETEDPVTPVDPGASGYSSVVDDLGVLTVSVPSTWTDVNGMPFTSDAGQEWASITASSDIQGYLDSWDVPGLEIAATKIQNGTQDQLRGLLESITGIYDSCETVVAEASPYDDSFYQGFESIYEGCGTAGTVAFAITAFSADGTAAVFVRAQVTSDLDADDVYTKVVQTFDTTVSRSARRG